MKNTASNMGWLAAASLLIGVAGPIQAQTPVPPVKPAAAPPAGAPMALPSLEKRFSMTQAKVVYPNGVEGLFDITYAAPPGVRPLKLDVYRKPGGKSSKPILIFAHGGGFMAGSNRAVEQPWGDMDKIMAQLAAAGYVVVAPTYRLSSEAKYPAQIRDVKTAIRWVRANAARFGADPERVGIWGTSVGGSVAALVGTSCGVANLEGADEGFADQSSCVTAAADWFGVTDMALLDQHAPPGGLVHNSPKSSQTALLGCQIDLCPKEFVQSANPIRYIDPSDRGTKFLIVHGEADLAVGWRQSQILQDALKSAGIESELTIVPGAGHYLEHATPAQSQKLLGDVLAFFAKTLKP